MVFKKPYAFMIKHFRLIHLIMLGSLVYILFVIRDLNSFFNSLYINHTYTYEYAADYIVKPVYFFIFIFFILSLGLLWLLRTKKKPIKFYLVSLLYIIVIFVLIAFMHSNLSTLVNSTLTSDRITFCRDFSFVATLPTYLFIAIFFVRGIGFNLKQFNFSKDFEELSIDEEDSQEFEIMIGQNSYKYIRLLRRFLREGKYYILENIIAIGVLLFVALLIGGWYSIRYYNEYHKKMKASEITEVDGITYKINNAYLTKEDFNGNIINKDYIYLIIDMHLYNRTNDNKTINLRKIAVESSKLIYYPKQTKNELFYDLGIPYKNNQIITPHGGLDSILIFELPSTISTNNYTLKVQYGLVSNSKKITTLYRKFNINAKRIDKDKSTTNLKLNETISSNVLNQNQFDLTVKSFALKDAYNNKYVSCTSSDKCTVLSDVIKPADVTKSTIFILDYESSMYDDAVFTKTFNTYNKVFENYCFINYTILSNEYTSKIKTISNSDVDNKLFATIERNIYNANSINFICNFRDNEYIYKLK